MRFQEAKSESRIRIELRRWSSEFLLYGDGVITPAISALSTVEGLKLDAPQLTPVVVPISVADQFLRPWELPIQWTQQHLRLERADGAQPQAAPITRFRKIGTGFTYMFIEERSGW
jgi:K+ potassium transporter